MKSYGFKLFILVFSITLIFSCGKDDDSPQPEPEAICSIIQGDYTYDEGTYNYDFNYDDQGRLVYIVTWTSTTPTVYTYSYSGNTITMNNGKWSYGTTMNDDGQPIQQHYEYNGVTADTEFQYSNGILVSATREHSTLGTSEYTYDWEDGDMVKRTINGTEVTTFEYYTDQPIREGDYIRYTHMVNYGVRLYESAHLIKRISSGSYDDFYEYEFDESGKISNITIMQTGEQPITLNYTYECE